MRKAWLVAVLAVAAGSAWAQEPDDRDEPRQPPLYVIRVLDNPYDLASFYRSSGSASGSFGSDASGSGFHNGRRGRYSIASFYRQGGGGRYSAFWQSGYQARPALAPGGYGRPYGNTIGENGDLFLFAPTFLAPVGPLTEAFFR
jgi:hypothetical protein